MTRAETIGTPSVPQDGERRAYVLKKLEETRRDCQWLLTLGIGSVFGVLAKEHVGDGWPRIAAIIGCVLAIVVSLLGALSIMSDGIDVSAVEHVLKARLKARYYLRNVASIFLAGAFCLLAIAVLVG